MKIVRDNAQALIILANYYQDADKAQDIVRKLMELQKLYDPRRSS